MPIGSGSVVYDRSKKWTTNGKLVPPPRAWTQTLILILVWSVFHCRHLVTTNNLTELQRTELTIRMCRRRRRGICRDPLYNRPAVRSRSADRQMKSQLWISDRQKFELIGGNNKTDPCRPRRVTLDLCEHQIAHVVRDNLLRRHRVWRSVCETEDKHKSSENTFKCFEIFVYLFLSANSTKYFVRYFV